MRELIDHLVMLPDASGWESHEWLYRFADRSGAQVMWMPELGWKVRKIHWSDRDLIDGGENWIDGRETELAVREILGQWEGEANGT